MRADAVAAHESAQNAASLALEVEKVGLIDSNIGSAAIKASSAALEASDLIAAFAAPDDEMNAAVKGGAGQESLQSRLDKSQSELTSALQRQEKLKKAADEAGSKIEAVPAQEPDGKPNPKRKKLDGLRRRLLDALASADQSVPAAQAASRTLSQSREESSTGQRRAAAAQASAEKAAAALSAQASALRQAAAEARAAVGTLSADTDGPQRTKIGRKIETVRDIAGSLRGQAEILLNRAWDFEYAYRAFEKTVKDFNGLRATLLDDLSQAQKQFDSAQSLLDQIRAVLDKD